MPVYEYRRPDGTTFEIIQKFSDDALTHDPETGVPVSKVLSAPAIHFKGKGFHNTDYGTKKRPVGGGSEDEGSGGSSEGGGSDGRSSSDGGSQDGGSGPGGTSTTEKSGSSSGDSSSGGASSVSSGTSGTGKTPAAAGSSSTKD